MNPHKRQKKKKQNKKRQKVPENRKTFPNIIHTQLINSSSVFCLFSACLPKLPSVLIRQSLPLELFWINPAHMLFSPIYSINNLGRILSINTMILTINAVVFFFNINTLIISIITMFPSLSILSCLLSIILSLLLLL